MKTISATKARANFFQLLKNTLKEHLAIRISSKEGILILISEQEYESLVETAEIMSNPGLVKSIQQADKDIQDKELYTLEEVFE